MHWRIAPPAPAEFRAQFPELHPVAVQLLWNRGVTDPAAIESFLSPDYERDLHDPFLFRDMRAACERVWRALASGEKIVIHGDYDADGVTGSALLMTTFRAAAEKMGADASNLSSYIPHREKEGYGVRNATVEKLAAEGATLMVTVDCGIGCAAEIALAKSLGMDAIVVDHHQVPERIPECLIIHPWVPGETYPYRSLAAVGVSFKFACGFVRFAAEQGAAFEPGFEKWLLDLVSIATVTDVVSLIGENRTLELYGLKVLNKTRRIGLRKLIEVAGLEPGKMDTTSVGFYIGPRINAASRMQHASLAFETLMAETAEQAAELAERLNQSNKDRQKYTEEIMVVARLEAAKKKGEAVQIIAGEGWSPGIVGLVAGKIMNDYGVPVFVFGKDGDKYVGSGRSIPGCNVVEGMQRAGKYLARFGGHPQACGLTIFGDDNYRGFCEIMSDFARETLAGQTLEPAISIDAELAMSQVTWDLVETLGRFEPHGEGNPKPKFVMRGLLLASVDPVGKTGKHARFGVRGDTPREKKLIGFNLFDRAKAFVPGSRIDAVVEVGVNEWNGSKQIQLKALDVAQAALAPQTV